MTPAGKMATECAAKTNAQPDKPAQRRPRRIAAHDPFGRAKEQADGGGDDREEEYGDKEDAATRHAVALERSVIEEGLQHGPAQQGSHSAGDRKIEPARSR